MQNYWNPLYRGKSEKSIEDKLAYIYKKGIIYVSDTAYTERNTQIKIIENNIAERSIRLHRYRAQYHRKTQSGNTASPHGKSCGLDEPCGGHGA